MESDDLIPSWLLRVLRYIALVDQGGALLTDSEIDAYAGTTLPEPPKGRSLYELWGTSMSLTGLERAALGFGRQRVVVAEYFVKVGWISAGFPRLTEVGKAIVKAVDCRGQRWHARGSLLQ